MKVITPESDAVEISIQMFVNVLQQLFSLVPWPSPGRTRNVIFTACYVACAREGLLGTRLAVIHRFRFKIIITCIYMFLNER